MGWVGTAVGLMVLDATSLLGYASTMSKNKHAQALAKLGASKGGHARAASLTATQRSQIALRAARARWGPSKDSA